MNLNGSFKQKKIYFTQVSNEAIRDNTLSLKAKGLYALIQSYITLEGFTLYKHYLQKQCKEGTRAFEGAWKELKDNGYLTQEKHKGADGTFYYIYDLLDKKCQTTPTFCRGWKTGVYNNTIINNTYSKVREVCPKPLTNKKHILTWEEYCSTNVVDAAVKESINYFIDLRIQYTSKDTLLSKRTWEDIASNWFTTTINDTEINIEPDTMLIAINNYFNVRFKDDKCDYSIILFQKVKAYRIMEIGAF